MTNTFALQRPAFANDTAIANGSYKFFMKALRVTGNRSDESAYDTWLSPQFRFMG